MWLLILVLALGFWLVAAVIWRATDRIAAALRQRREGE